MNKEYSIWAVHPAMYNEITAFYKRVMESDDVVKMAYDYRNKEKQVYKPRYQVAGRIAVIGVSGTLTNRESLFSFLMGGVSLPRVQQELLAADNDPAVDGVVLNTDTVGGPVAGLDTTAAIIKGMKKPVIGFTDGGMLSAGYWLGAACKKIVCSRTAELGSIGVLMVLFERTEMMKKEGVKANVIRGGKFKAIGLPYEKLTEEKKAILQEEVTTMQNIFFDFVAGNRPLSREDLEGMEGRAYIGQQAVKIGLADKVGSLGDAISMAGLINSKGVIKMDLKQLKSEHPELVASIEAAAVKGMVAADAAETQTTEAVATCQGNILAMASAFFGDEQGKQFAGIVNSGVTLEQFQAIRGATPAAPAVETPAPETPVPAAADTKIKILQNLEQDETPPVVAGGEASDTPTDFMAAAASIAKEKGCTMTAAFKLAAKEYPALYAQHTKGGK